MTIEPPQIQTGDPEEKLSAQVIWRMFQESDRRSRETERLMNERFAETERLFNEQRAETERYLKTASDRQDRKLNKLEALFTTQWGKMIESLVNGDLVKVLRKYGIAIQRTSTRVKGRFGKMNFEFDIIAHNGEEIVVVEVKTTLRPEDVKDFRERLPHVKEWLPDLANKKIIGAMAFLTDDGHSAVMAEKAGMLIIRATGNSASIVNSPDFKPKTW